MTKRILSEHLLDMFGAIKYGHFILSSGRHAKKLIDMDKLIQHVKVAEVYIAEIVDDAMYKFPDIICGPMTNGAIMAYSIAEKLHAEFSFTLRDKDGVWRFGNDLLDSEGKTAYIVDDVWTTGTTVNKTYKLLEDSGIEVVGVGVLVDRRLVHKELTFEEGGYFAVGYVPLQSFQPEECPICKGVVTSRSTRGDRK